MISNSASTASIRLTISIELKPTWESCSSTNIDRVIECFARISLTS